VEKEQAISGLLLQSIKFVCEETVLKDRQFVTTTEKPK
jgi:hypothetical protein